MVTAAQRKASIEAARARNDAQFAKFTAALSGTSSAQQTLFSQVASKPASVFNTVNTIQDQLLHVGLSQAVIDAQQALSEKYGIPTFDIEGSISTVPLTRPFDPSINVGTGKFTQSDFNQSLVAIVNGFQEPWSVGDAVASVIEPITDFFDNILSSPDLSGLPDEEIARLAAINRRLDDLTRAIPDAEADYRIKQSVAASQNYPAFHQAAARAKQFRDGLYTERDLLIEERTRLVNKSNIAREFLVKIDAAIAELGAIRRAEFFTIELRAEAEGIFERNQALLNKIAAEGITIATESLLELGQLTRIVRQRFAEPITQAQNKTEGTIDAIMGFLGTAASFIPMFSIMSEVFNLIVNPDASVIQKTITAIHDANIASAKETKT